jgi:hypothetical protein
MGKPACIQIAEACEQYAEGAISADLFMDLCVEADDASSDPRAVVASAQGFVQFLLDEGKLNESVEAVECAFGYAAAIAAGDLEDATTLGCAEALQRYASFRTGCETADRKFGDYCRDVFGPNPFALPTFAAAWRTTDVLGLARGIDAERAFDRMPILADALQDAGCDDQRILDHCRGPSPHVRGCWVVDLVLGKQ